MKYIRKFETEEEKQSWLSQGRIIPNVVLVGNNQISYNISLPYVNLDIPIESGNSVILTIEQMNFIKDYCSQFGEICDSVPQGFSLTINNKVISRCNWNSSTGYYQFTDMTTFELVIEGSLNYGYLVVY